MKRIGTAHWIGNLKEGKGEISSQSTEITYRAGAIATTW
jgi:hypothetical protein